MRKILLSLAVCAIALVGQDKANWKIQYELPKQVKANYETPLTVKITSADGKPVAGADVETILTMVEMDHGEFKEAAKQVKPGVYETKHKFIMVGAWQIEVKAKKGAASASQKFRYEVKE
jgi:nitrogen fixation protein FixH